MPLVASLHSMPAGTHSSTAGSQPGSPAGVQRQAKEADGGAGGALPGAQQGCDGVADLQSLLLLALLHSWQLAALEAPVLMRLPGLMAALAAVMVQVALEKARRRGGAALAVTGLVACAAQQCLLGLMGDAAK